MRSKSWSSQGHITLTALNALLFVEFLSRLTLENGLENNKHLNHINSLQLWKKCHRVLTYSEEYVTMRITFFSLFQIY